MATIASLSILLGADVSKLAPALKKGVSQVQDFAAKVAAVAGGIALFEGAKAGLSAAFDGAVGQVSAGLDRIDKLGDTAQQLGVTTQALSELEYAARLTGSSSEDLDAALGKMNQNLGDSALKANPTSEALERLGLDAKEIAGLSPDAAFKKITGGFEKIPSAADKASLAMDIFGKGGIKVLNTLGAGSGELDRLGEEAKRLGVSISQVDQAKVAMAKDSLDHAAAAVEGLGNQFAIKLAPFIEVAAEKFAEFLAGINEGGSGVEKALDGLVKGAAWVINALDKMQDVAVEGFARIGLAAIAAARAVGLGSKTLDAVAERLQASVDRARAGKPGDELLAYYESVKSKAAAAAAAIAKTAVSNLQAGTSFDAVGKAVKDCTAKLQEQVETFGMSASQVELYKLSQQGATEAQLEQVEALSDQLQALEQQKKDYEELKGFAKGFYDQTRTASEKYEAELEKINAAVDAGLIDQETASRALKKAAKDRDGDDQVRFAGALELGSASARSAILQATSGRGRDGVEQASRTTAQNTGRTNWLLQKLTEKLTGTPQVEYSF